MTVGPRPMASTLHPVGSTSSASLPAETFDVIVEPSGQDAFTIFAQDTGRTGYVSGTLAVREGLRAPVPEIGPKPLLSMDDMGHGAMGGGDHDMSTMSHAATAGGAMAATDHSGHDMSSMAGGSMAGWITAAAAAAGTPAAKAGIPLDMQTMAPTPKLEIRYWLRATSAECSPTPICAALPRSVGARPGARWSCKLTGHWNASPVVQRREVR